MRLCPSDLMRKSPPDSRRTRTNWGRPIHCVLREPSRNISTIRCRTVTPITAQNLNITSSLEKLRGKSITSSLKNVKSPVTDLYYLLSLEKIMGYGLNWGENVTC